MVSPGLMIAQLPGSLHSIGAAAKTLVQIPDNREIIKRTIKIDKGFFMIYSFQK
jgi:hypothetical protein